MRICRENPCVNASGTNALELFFACKPPELSSKTDHKTEKRLCGTLLWFHGRHQHHGKTVKSPPRKPWQINQGHKNARGDETNRAIYRGSPSVRNGKLRWKTEKPEGLKHYIRKSFQADLPHIFH